MKNKIPVYVSCFLLILFVCSNSTFAKVVLPSIISDNMVLQQNAEVTIWGWSNPGEKISVLPGWTDNKIVAIGDENGNWKAFIKTPKAGTSYSITVKGENFIELKHVLIGEVWLCSGQSNMSMPMSGWDKQPIHGGDEDIAESSNRYIRLFTVKKAISDKPLKDLVGKWVECSPETVKGFSAIGYYFSRKIHQETGYPVGMICSAWEGTIAQSWMRIDTIKNDDNLRTLLDWHDEKLAIWKKACDQAKKEHKTPPIRHGGIRPQDEPGVIYNAMIAPILDMNIKGVIWYQGEGNVANAYVYRDLFPTLIKNWRCDFKNFSMPFYFVQLANYTSHSPGAEIKPYRGMPRDNIWARLREAQFMTNSLKNTGMTVAIDIGETNNIHPGNKKEFARRLACWALVKDYGKELEYSGPLYQGYWIEDDKIRIAFSHADGGLLLKGDITKSFAIAGKDKKFVWADIKIEGSQVLVFSNRVKKPVAVRYAWDNDPEVCLYNVANLPASPFRTDDWNDSSF